MVPNKSDKVKKPPKPLKPIEKPISKVKKAKKKNYHNFSIYIYKILRSVTEEKMGISQKSMSIMNSFVYDMLEKVASEAGKLVMLSKKHTLSSREVQTAVRLLIPGELAKHANMDALKAVTMFHNSQE